MENKGENDMTTIYKSFGLTDIGKKRKENQDTFSIDEDIGLYLVADGLGGLDYGKETAEYVVKELSAGIRKQLSMGSIRSIPAMIGNEINKVDSGVRKEFGDNSATTIVVVLIPEGNIYVTHVGDSRAYIFYNGILRRITEDHNVANQYVKEGLLTKTEAMSHPSQCVLTCSVGMMNDTDDKMCVEVFQPENGMRILLCSDGLTGMMTENTMEKLLTNEPDTAILVQKFIDKANSTGGRDNITAVLVDVTEE